MVKMSGFLNSLIINCLCEFEWFLPSVLFPFASSRLVICRKSRYHLRQIIASSVSDHTLRDTVYHPLKPSLTAIETINDTFRDNQSHSNRRAKPSQMSFPLRRMREKTDYNLSRSFNKNFSLLMMTFYHELELGVHRVKLYIFSLFYVFVNFRRRLLSTTLTLEKAIKALAQMGVICQSWPKRQGTPAASGMQTTL